MQASGSDSWPVGPDHFSSNTALAGENLGIKKASKKIQLVRISNTTCAFPTKRP
jgi:hypothetical protein